MNSAWCYCCKACSRVRHITFVPVVQNREHANVLAVVAFAPSARASSLWKLRTMGSFQPTLLQKKTIRVVAPASTGQNTVAARINDNCTSRKQPNGPAPFRLRTMTETHVLKVGERQKGLSRWAHITCVNQRIIFRRRPCTHSDQRTNSNNK